MTKSKAIEIANEYDESKASNFLHGFKGVIAKTLEVGAVPLIKTPFLNQRIQDAKVKAKVKERIGTFSWNALLVVYRKD